MKIDQKVDQGPNTNIYNDLNDNFETNYKRVVQFKYKEQVKALAYLMNNNFSGKSWNGGKMIVLSVNLHT